MATPANKQDQNGSTLISELTKYGLKDYHDLMTNTKFIAVRRMISTQFFQELNKKTATDAISIVDKKNLIDQWHSFSDTLEQHSLSCVGKKTLPQVAWNLFGIGLLSLTGIHAAIATAFIIVFFIYTAIDTKFKHQELAHQAHGKLSAFSKDNLIEKAELLVAVVGMGLAASAMLFPTIDLIGTIALIGGAAVLAIALIFLTKSLHRYFFEKKLSINKTTHHLNRLLAVNSEPIAALHANDMKKPINAENSISGPAKSGPDHLRTETTTSSADHPDSSIIHEPDTAPEAISEDHRAHDRSAAAHRCNDAVEITTSSNGNASSLSQVSGDSDDAEGEGDSGETPQAH